MGMVNYSNQEKFSIWYNTDTRTIRVDWRGFFLSEEYRNVLETAFEVFKKYRLKKWINNMKNMSVISVADQEWTSNNWLGRLIECGLTQMTVIQSDDVFHQVAMRNIQNQAILAGLNWQNKEVLEKEFC
jgi:(p)ppGpp synthase/HD superfamily hydrolase